MKFNGIMVLIYGILVLLGGLIGYWTKGSLGSLFAGIACGTILIVCAVGLFRTSILAFFAAICVSGLLAIFFAYRYYLTGSMVPGGGMGLLSFIIFLLLVSAKNTSSVKSR